MLYSLGSKSNNNINSKKNRVTITYIKPYSLTTYFIKIKNIYSILVSFFYLIIKY
jgi:hypothetical protein